MRGEEASGIRTGWVAPPKPIRGLDHLGVMAPCIALYGQLLPGITNVTHRARYYSFHPWLIWSFEQRYSDHSRDTFARVLRRAECLLTLVGAHHAMAMDEDDRDHGVTLVGRDKLLGAAQEILDGATVDLEDYAGFEGDHRYFKNRLGGLGQYYFGPLRDLGVLGYPKGNPRNPPGYDSKHGLALAEAFAAGVDGDRFFQVLERGVVGKDQLDQLINFCPCKLVDNKEEHDLLLDIFLARTDHYLGKDGDWRRNSFALLLDFVGHEVFNDELGLQDNFRAACYSAALPDGDEWTIPDKWRDARLAWRTYQRNELLSVAVQGMFWATLHEIAIRGGRVNSVNDAGRVTRELVDEALGSKISEENVSHFLDRIQDDLPSLSSWSDENHELIQAWRLVDLAGKKNPAHGDLLSVIETSLKVMLGLIARGLRQYPYIDFDFDPKYFSQEGIHLLSLRHWADNWKDWKISRWAEWLGTTWGVNSHLQVALRKLRTECRDTFRIRPLDGALLLVEVPDVRFTSPRLSCARQILRDLQLIALMDDDMWVLTELGKEQLGVCRD